MVFNKKNLTSNTNSSKRYFVWQIIFASGVIVGIILGIYFFQGIFFSLIIPGVVLIITIINVFIGKYKNIGSYSANWVITELVRTFKSEKYLKTGTFIILVLNLFLFFKIYENKTDPANYPFNAEYLNLEKSNINYLAEGIPPPNSNWSDAKIVDNEVLENVKKIVRIYSEENDKAENSTFIWEQGEENNSELSEHNGKNFSPDKQPKRFFLGDLTANLASYASEEINTFHFDNEQILKNILNSDDWYIFIDENCYQDCNIIEDDKVNVECCFNLVKKMDYEWFKTNYTLINKWFLDNTKEQYFVEYRDLYLKPPVALDFFGDIANQPEFLNILPIFFRADMYGCGGSGLGYTLYLDFPKINVQVLGIENISNKSINIRNFKIFQQENLKFRFSSDEGYNKKLSEDLIPSKILKPGEKVLIPLRLMIEFPGKEKFEDEALESEDVKNADKEKLFKDYVNSKKPQDLITFSYRDNSSAFQMPAKTVLSWINNGSFPFSNNKYLYGPSIKIDKITINNWPYKIRELKPKFLVIAKGSLNSGSCPYVYSYSSKKNSWMQIGRVLVGVNSLKKKKFDIIELKQFSGKLMIKENEAETSYIDSAYVKIIYKNGNYKILKPDSNKLKNNDNNYVKLNKNENVILNFNDKYDKNDISKVKLVVSGYYAPLSHKK